MTLEDSLLSRTIATPGPLDTDCLVWTGAKTGGFAACGKQVGVPSSLTHRALWALRYGPIAKGAVLDRICSNRACCNVDHMKITTRTEKSRLGMVSLDDLLSRKTIHASGPLDSDCRIWTGTKDKNGYAWCRREGMPSQFVHRSLWILKNGPITDTRVLDHLCRVPACCNPDHLELVTQRENILRGVDSRNGVGARSVCRKGHALSGYNLRIWMRDGKYEIRCCRACARERALRDYYAKKGSVAK